MRGLLLEMLSRLTGAYNKNPDGLIGRLFSLFATSLDGIEEALQVVDLWRDVNQARGSTLDRIGLNFGVQREGTSDAFYRLMIKVKVTALLSGGDVNTVINATSVLFDIDPAQVEAQELFPAKMRVILNEEDIAPEYMQHAASTAAIIKRIMAAGVGKEILLRKRRRHICDIYPRTTAIVYQRIRVRRPNVQKRYAATVYCNVTTFATIRVKAHPIT